MSLGFVYLVFLPSIVTTPLGGRAVARFGVRTTMWSALAIAGAGLPLLLMPALAAVVTGLALIGVGTFLAQAAATGFIGGAAPSNRALASGLYLASYFLGGLVGSAVLGQLYVAVRLVRVRRGHRHRARHRRAADCEPDASEEFHGHRACGRGMEPIGTRQCRPAHVCAKVHSTLRFC